LPGLESLSVGVRFARERWIGRGKRRHERGKEKNLRRPQHGSEEFAERSTRGIITFSPSDFLFHPKVIV